MRFLARAGELLSDYNCDYCEQPIRPADPVQWDVDGDENGTRVTDIAHAICYEHAREAATRICERCGLQVFMKVAKAKARGWVSKWIPHSGEIWKCPSCAGSPRT
jgi:hypothetical protein